MAKLTMPIIESLYTYGKAVHNREIGLNEATEKVLAMYPGNIADSSASFYIGLYSEYLSGKGSTWNQNSSLVLYYVEHIATELGNEIGAKAFQAGMKFAKAKTKNKLINDLNTLWKQISEDAAPEVLDVNEAAFEEWLRNNVEKSYTDNTVRRYIRALKKSEEWLDIKLTVHVMDTVSADDFKTVETEIKSAKDFERINQDHGHGDLSAALRAYQKFLADQSKDAEDEEEGEEEVVNINTKDALAKIKNYIFARGFDYPDGLIENFYLSLKSKPFVILAGTSGTGKTRLVKLFAEAIGAVFKLVSVRPDWSDGSDLFGHTDLNGKFIPGPVCAAFDTAINEPKRPVFLCLDEMNLARVEYYLSDFLSVIESREIANGHIVTEGIAQYENGIPENLYIIGTVNMDETTFPFSKKVLDRANTIEFSYVDLIPKQRTGETFAPQELPNSFLRTEYLVLAADCTENMELVEKICAELQALNGKLVKANAHVGFRVRDEIVFYMLNNEKAGNLLSYEQAMDKEIMQKVLPRIQGSSMAIKTLLIDMFKFCMGSSSGIDADTGNVGEQMKNAATSAKYPESAKKIGYMMARFEDDGFTSYWL